MVSREMIPDIYALEQNYPNPFNPTTKIRYTIPNNGLVTLKIYNTIGEEVAVLVNMQQELGKYEVEFNGEKYNIIYHIWKIKSFPTHS